VFEPVLEAPVLVLELVLVLEPVIVAMVAIPRMVRVWVLSRQTIPGIRNL
jgi:hypothetical protein